MSKTRAVPDAWDDDWEAVADKQENEPQNEETVLPVKLTKAERRAQHAEFNKKLWETAETPEQPLFLAARNDVPLKTDFKPAVKLLSRKPPPRTISQNDPAAGMAGMSIRDDEDDSEEEARKKNEASFAERQAKAQREREEKQRKYHEVRERLFGSPSAPDESSKKPSSSQNGGSRNSSRGKGRGRGDREAPSPSSGQSPARASNPRKQLYDPGYNPKPNSVFLQKRDTPEKSEKESRPSTPGEEQPIRAPRGPDGSGRGGFGFSPRGGKNGFPVV
ncbi:hypothetical protein K402DRAFT_335881 [Aulographum hederae CBS 113979]|uniref:Uncharacterized protein n=1 Tax=Aulographum hederae CBS 113979 TaxID=1176131 RepID=A0A6G1GV19_9PEZI|nr:hypothetical protein K402DRAFT_335881 [Aulographum hederae CBS 113979]